MAKNRSKGPPSRGSIDELVDFFDTHDMGEYWDRMPEGHFDVSVERKRHLVAIDEELVTKLIEIAKSKRVPAQKLVNSWLREKIHELR